MQVYNIRKEKFADKLVASGIANRWNRKDEFVIYTSGSRALSTLELVVHRAHIQIEDSYLLLILSLNISDDDIITIHSSDLPDNWKSIQSYPTLQAIGSEWYRSYSSLILKVPSSIIPQEYNYIIHTRHPDFSKKVSIAGREPFTWDRRLL